MERNDEFHSSRLLYHGTPHEIPVGDIILPSSAVGNRRGAGVAGDSRAYASPQFGVAYNMGRDARDYGSGGAHKDKPVRVYSVQPVDHEDVKSAGFGIDHVDTHLTSSTVGQIRPGGEVTSAKGFKVMAEIKDAQKVNEDARSAAFAKKDQNNKG